MNKPEPPSAEDLAAAARIADAALDPARYWEERCARAEARVERLARQVEAVKALATGGPKVHDIYTELRAIVLDGPEATDDNNLRTWRKATEADEAELVARYGKTSWELADEAEKGYDVTKMRERKR